MLGTLATHFAPENIAAVQGNPVAAGAKLDAAKAALDAASTALAGNDRDTAVQRVAEAETAITEASAQLDAVDATQKALALNETELTASIAAVQQDVTQAHGPRSAAGTGTDRAADVDRAAALLTQAQQLAAATPLDVVGATRAVTEANTVIDSVLAGVQEAEAAAQRNTAAAQAAYANASASVAQANALIAADSGSAAGRHARTRVAEAQQYLTRAQSLMATDPASAAQASQTADSLADEAIAESGWPVGYRDGRRGGRGRPHRWLWLRRWWLYATLGWRWRPRYRSSAVSWAASCPAVAAAATVAGMAGPVDSVASGQEVSVVPAISGGGGSSRSSGGGAAVERRRRRSPKWLLIASACRRYDDASTNKGERTVTDILGRIGNVLRANLNDMLDHAENPRR